MAYLSNDKIIVHQINDVDNTKGKYSMGDELSLILPTSYHLVVCKENLIYLYPLTNDTALITNVERDSSFETDVCYLRIFPSIAWAEPLTVFLNPEGILILFYFLLLIEKL